VAVILLWCVFCDVTGIAVHRYCRVSFLCYKGSVFKKFYVFLCTVCVDCCARHYFMSSRKMKKKSRRRIRVQRCGRREPHARRVKSDSGTLRQRCRKHIYRMISQRGIISPFETRVLSLALPIEISVRRWNVYVTCISDDCLTYVLRCLLW
jgi:hypothetical protein